MNDVIANLFVDVHPSIAIQTLFYDGKFFVIASAVSAYSLWQQFVRVLPDGKTNSLCHVLNKGRSSRFDVTFHALRAKTIPNIMLRFQVSWWNLAVWKSFDASVEDFVCQFSTDTSNLNIIFEFPLRTYNRNTSNCLPLVYGQSCFLDSGTSQFGYF